MVLAALVTAWRLAIWPTSRSPLSVKPTTVGVVRPPSLFGTICTAPPSGPATQRLVVPRSIPTTCPIPFLSRGGGPSREPPTGGALRLTDGERLGLPLVLPLVGAGRPPPPRPPP